MKSFGFTICLIFVLSATGFAQDYAVLMQESPAGAGQIKPGMGVHTFNVNETVTLTTVPEPGWHFVYWLGDVSDPTANRTTVAVDGPKIIIAVFRRDEYEFAIGGGAAVSMGPPKLTPRYDRFGRGGSSGGGEEEEPPEPPYPPIPEPQTAILLSVGACLIRYKNRLSAKQGSKISQHHYWHRGPGPRNPLCK